MNENNVVVSLHTGRSPHGWLVKVTQSIFVLLGIGILIPWNAFISAKDYFDSRLCSLSIGSKIEPVFAAVFNLSSVVSMGLVILVQWSRDRSTGSDETIIASPSSEVTSLERPRDSTATAPQAHSRDRNSMTAVMIPLAFSVAVFLAQTSMVLMLSIRPSSFEVLTILSLAVCGVCVSVGSAGIVATAGLFDPSTAMNPYLAGQSLGGVIVSMANFLAAAWEDPSSFCSDTGSTGISTLQPMQGSICSEYSRVDRAVFCYFLSGSMVLLACIVGYWHIHRVQVAVPRDDYETVVQGEVLAAEDAVERSPRLGLELHLRHVSCQEDGRGLNRSTSDTGPLALRDDYADRNPAGDLDSGESHEPVTDMLEIWRLVKGPSACIFLTFFVTLALFPGLTSSLHSVRRCQTSFRLSNDLFTPFSFVLFNVGDFTGRVVQPLLPFAPSPTRSEKLVVASLARFVFFPLLFLCPRNPPSPFRWKVPSDLYSIAVQFAFAFTNGWLVTAAFVHAPTLVPNATGLKERMSEILQFALAFGLLTGSFFSFPVSNFAS